MKNPVLFSIAAVSITLPITFSAMSSDSTVSTFLVEEIWANSTFATI